MSTDSISSRRKVCFVTIGATASFDPLLVECLSIPFIKALSELGFTELLVQYGKEGKVLFENTMAEETKHKDLGLQVTGFDFNLDGIDGEMRTAKGASDEEEGIIVSHAGSGSILAALRIGATLIVVPNDTLMDNHQLELAEALQDQGYVVHGKLNELPAALRQAESLRQRQKEWPPVNSGVHRQSKGIKGVMDEEMGFLD